MSIKFPGSLHGHTDFSNLRLRDSTITVSSLINRAIELGHTCVAFTEHETVANAIKIEEAYDKVKNDNPNFKVIRGNEIYLVRNELNKDNFVQGTDKYYHFILLAKDAVGHEQIRELSTRAWLRAFETQRMTRVPTYYSDLEEVIKPNPGHIFASTACLGGCLPTQLLRYRENQDSNLYQQIINWCNYMEGIFGKGNFFLEMQPSNNEEQIYVNNELVKLSKLLDIKTIITCDEHYLTLKDKPIHKAFLTAQEGEREVDEFYSTTYLMSDEEVRSYMKIDGNILEDSFKTIQYIADNCENYSLKKPLRIPRMKWLSPRPIKNLNYWLEQMPMMKTFYDSEYKEDKLLIELLINKIESDNQYQNQETYNEVDACLNDTWISSEVNNTRWSAYFLNLQVIVKTCWDAGTLLGCGRGSGVGFILLHLLDIVQVNPLREETKTFRWRFLNPERVSVLDVDIDIESSKRQQVLNKFREVYGELRVANVLTLGTEKAKSAIQTAARGLGIDVDIARYLSSMIVSDRGQARTLKQTFYGDEENNMVPNKQFRYEMEHNYPELWEVAQEIEGLICHSGIHAGGVVFVDEDFVKSTALMRASSDEIITQFELHDLEKASQLGLVNT